MHASILFFAASLAAPAMPHVVSFDEVVSITNDVVTVVNSEPPLFPVIDGDEAAAKTQTAKLLTLWSWKETRWQNIVGKSTAGYAESFGPLQVTGLWFELGPYSLPGLLAWRQNGLRLGLRVMIHLRDKCGSVKSGLGAYAGRACGDCPGFVFWRCHLAGVNCG